MNVLLSLLVVCLAGHLASGTWTDSHRTLITKIHNDYRRGTKQACDMTDLVYDKKIEASAKRWAKRCVFQHEQGQYGENLAEVTKRGKESDRIKEMAKLWYDEIKDFQYGTGNPGAAGHYTQNKAFPPRKQSVYRNSNFNYLKLFLSFDENGKIWCWVKMIWAKSRKLGCYAADCNGMYYLVCYYDPPGNLLGTEPYQKNCKGGKNNGNSGKGSGATKTRKNIGTGTTNNKNSGHRTITNNNNNEDWNKFMKNFGGDGDWKTDFGGDGNWKTDFGKFDE